MYQKCGLQLLLVYDGGNEDVKIWRSVLRAHGLDYKIVLETSFSFFQGGGPFLAVAGHELLVDRATPGAVQGSLEEVAWLIRRVGGELISFIH